MSIWILKKISHVESVESLKWNCLPISFITIIRLIQIGSLGDYDRGCFLHRLLKWIRRSHCFRARHWNNLLAKCVILIIISIDKACDSSFHRHWAHQTCLPRHRTLYCLLANKSWTSWDLLFCFLLASLIFTKSIITFGQSSLSCNFDTFPLFCTNLLHSLQLLNLFFHL